MQPKGLILRFLNDFKRELRGVATFEDDIVGNGSDQFLAVMSIV